MGGGVIVDGDADMGEGRIEHGAEVARGMQPLIEQRVPLVAILITVVVLPGDILRATAPARGVEVPEILRGTLLRDVVVESFRQIIRSHAVGGHMRAPVTGDGVELDGALDRVQPLLDAELIDAVEDLLLVVGDGGLGPPQGVILGDGALGDIVDGGRDRDLLRGAALTRDHGGGAVVLGVGLAGVRHDGRGERPDRPGGVGEAERVGAVLEARGRGIARSIDGHHRCRGAWNHQRAQNGGGEQGRESRSEANELPGFFQGGCHGALGEVRCGGRGDRDWERERDRAKKGERGEPGKGQRTRALTLGARAQQMLAAPQRP